jgi:hypothetical protein
MDDKKSMLIEKNQKCNHSNGSSLDRKYKINFLIIWVNNWIMITPISNLFSVQGTTRQFIISHKTERIKNWLFMVNEHWKCLEMNYSSVAHLSSQFKSYWIISITLQLKDKTKSNRGNGLKNSLIFLWKSKNH